jgi:type IV secretory pathway VirB4 component
VGCIVVSESRRGKSFLLNFLVDCEAKYGGFISIFDIGGSCVETAIKNGGTITRCGPNGPRQNPFDVDTERNRQFAYNLVKKLLINGGAEIGPEEDAEIHARIGFLFGMERCHRRLKHLILPATLQPYLNKWIEGGVYGRLFDNVEDELSLSHMNNFEFEDMEEGTSDLTGALLYSLRFRLRSVTHADSNLGVPKLEVYDELFRHLQQEEMADQIVATGNTAAKHLGGIILATQSAKALGKYANLIRTNCPDAWFLGGSFDRQQYIDLFELNEQQLALIPTLQRGESLLVRKDDFAKVLKLDVDERSKWHYTTHPKDRQRRAEYIAKYGRPLAFDYLVAEATAK